MASANTSVIPTAKKVLRQAVAKKLQSLSDADVQSQSLAVLQRLLTLPAFRNSKAVSCYLSMKYEVDTSGIVQAILRDKKALFAPKIANRRDNQMDLLQVYSEEDVASFPSGVWGIKEPGPEWEGRRRASACDQEASPLDMILVPGVAFDSSMSRLGHGKGYYDFFINTYTSDRPKPCLVALALREQIVNEGDIPMAEHDRRMDYIVTPDGILGNP